MSSDIYTHFTIKQSTLQLSSYRLNKMQSLIYITFPGIFLTECISVKAHKYGTVIHAVHGNGFSWNFAFEGKKKQMVECLFPLNL